MKVNELMIKEAMERFKERLKNLNETHVSAKIKYNMDETGV